MKYIMTVFINTILAGLAGYLIASNRQAEGLILLAMTLITVAVIVLISEDKKLNGGDAWQKQKS